MKNNVLKRFLALALVFFITFSGVPTVALSDGTDAAVLISENVEAVQAMIDALPDAAAVNGMTPEEASALNSQLSAAADAYDALSAEEQDMVTGIDKLEALGNTLAGYVAPAGYQLEATFNADLTYTGSAQSLSDYISHSLTLDGEAAESYSVYYSLSENGEKTASVEATDAGDYTVYVFAAIDDTYVASDTVTATIAQATPKLVVETVDHIDAYMPGVTDINDIIKSVQITGVNGEVLDTLSEGEYNISISSEPLVSKIYVRISLANGWENTTGNTNYTSLTGSVSSDNKLVSCPIVYTLNTWITNLNSLRYTGDALEVNVSAQLRDNFYNEMSGASFEYKLGDGDWSSSFPKVTNAGSYTLYVRARLGDEVVAARSVPFNVAKASPDVKVNLKSTTIYLYEGETLTDEDIIESVTVNGTVVNDYKVYYTNWVDNFPVSSLYTNFYGQARVSFPNGMELDKDNYNVDPEHEYDSTYFSVAEPYYRLEVTPAEGLVWTGDYQQLISAPVLMLGDRIVEDAKFVYCLDEGTPTTEIPTAKDANTSSKPVYSVTIFASLNGEQVAQETLYPVISPAEATALDVVSNYDSYYYKSSYTQDDAKLLLENATFYALFGDKRIALANTFYRGFNYDTPMVIADGKTLKITGTLASNYSQDNIIVPQGMGMSLNLPIEFYILNMQANSGLVYTGEKLQLLSSLTMTKDSSTPDPTYNYVAIDASGNSVASGDSQSIDQLLENVCATAAGTYTIRLTATNPEDSSQFASRTVTATIAKAQPTVAVTGASAVYNGNGYEAAQLVSAVTLSGNALAEDEYNIAFAADETKLTDGKAVNAGDYKVIVTLTDAAAAKYSNYDCSGSTEATATVSPMETAFTRVNGSELPPLEYSGNAYTAESFRSSLPGLMGYQKINNEFELLDADFLTEGYVNLRLQSSNFKDIASAKDVGEYWFSMYAAKDIVLGNYYIGKDTRYSLMVNITPKAITPSITFPSEVEYTDSLSIADFVTVTCGEGLIGSDVITDAYTVTFNGSTALPTAPGTYTVVVSPKAESNYTFTEVSASVTVYRTLNIQNIAVVYNPEVAYDASDVLGWLWNQFSDQYVGDARPTMTAPTYNDSTNYSIQDAGTYTFTAHLSEPNGYRLANDGKFTLTIDPARGVLNAASSGATFAPEDIDNPAKFVTDVKVTLDGGAVVTLSEDDYTVVWADIVTSLSPATGYPVEVSLKEGSQAAANMFTERPFSMTITTGKQLAKLAVWEDAFTDSTTYDRTAKWAKDFLQAVHVNIGTESQPVFDEWYYGHAYFTAAFTTEAKTPGEYTIVVSPTEALREKYPNYEILPCEATFTITPAEVTVTPTGTKTYGETDPAGYTLSAAKDTLTAEAEAALSGMSVSFERESGEDVGEYAYTGMIIDGKSYTLAAGTPIRIGNFNFVMAGNTSLTIEKKPVGSILGTLASPAYTGKAHEAIDFIPIALDDYYLMDAGASNQIAKINPLTDLTLSIKDNVVPIAAGEYTLVIGLSEALAKNYSFGTQEVKVYIKPAEGTLQVTPKANTFTGGDFYASDFIEKVELVDANGNVLVDLTETGEYSAAFTNSIIAIINVNHDEQIVVKVTGSNCVAPEYTFTPVIAPLPVTFYLKRNVTAVYGDEYKTSASFSWRTDASYEANVADVLNPIASEAQGFVTADGSEGAPDVGIHDFLSAKINGTIVKVGETVESGNYAFQFDPNDKKLTVDPANATLDLRLGVDADDLVYQKDDGYNFEELQPSMYLKVTSTGEEILVPKSDLEAPGFMMIYEGDYSNVLDETVNAGNYVLMAYLSEDSSLSKNYTFNVYPFVAECSFTVKKQKVNDVYASFQTLIYDGEAHGIADFWYDDAENPAYMEAEIDGRIELTYDDFKFIPANENVTSITNAGEILLIKITLSDEMAKNFDFSDKDERLIIDPLEAYVHTTARNLFYDGKEHSYAEFIGKVELKDADGNFIIEIPDTDYTVICASSPAPDNLTDAQEFAVDISVNRALYPNYYIKYSNGHSVSRVSIHPAPVTLSPAESHSKVYGQSDPESYAWNFTAGEGLESEFRALLEGAYCLRESGEAVGTYPYTSAVVNGTRIADGETKQIGNFSITFAAANSLEIKPAASSMTITGNGLTPVYSADASYIPNAFVDKVELHLDYADSEDKTITLAEDVDYELVFDNGADAIANAGVYKVTAKLLPTSRYYGNLSGNSSASLDVHITKAEAKIDVSGVKTLYTYTGKKQTVSSGATLNHSECELVYANNSFTTVAEGYGKVVTITAAETANYKAAEATVTLKVNKAAAKIDVSGVQTVYTYTGKKQTVSSGATLNHSECELIYANNSFTTVAEGYGKVVTITAAETANYKAAEAEVTLTVHPAAPGDTAYPAVIYPVPGKLTYGQKVAESTLAGGSTAIGSFAWDAQIAEQKPHAGLNSLKVVFTPHDTENFAWADTDLSRKVEITVDPYPITFTVESAEKTYGDADPEISVAISNPLEGDTLHYTISRATGENAGDYAYIVTLGENLNYTIALQVGTLSILPRDISGKEITVSGAGNQAYAGSALYPQPVVKFGDTTLTEGVDYSLSYYNNTEPGTAVITITGKGNFTGSCTSYFTILPPAEETIPGKEAIEQLLGTAATPSIVFNADYQPESYELLNTVVEDDAIGNSVLVCAFPNQDGEIEQRSLILSAAQLAHLAEKQEIEHLIFENGDAIAEMDMADLLSGNLAKLMRMILSGQEITAETLRQDFSAVEEATLSAAELTEFNVEIRIMPVETEDDSIAYEISVHLRWDDQELNVSEIIPSLTVCIAVDALVNEENFATFTALYAIAHQAPEAAEGMLLPGALLLIPDELPKHQDDVAHRIVVAIPEEADGQHIVTYNPKAQLTPYRHYALAADYAGEGLYRVCEVK